MLLRYPKHPDFGMQCNTLLGIIKMIKKLMFATAIIFAGNASATSINYAPDGGSINAWGPDSYANQSYGEIFTAPQAVLDDYTLTVVSNNPFPFVSQVYAWDGSQTAGSALYTSASKNTSSNSTAFTFAPDIALTAGDMYIAMVTNQPNGVSLGGSGYAGMASGTGPDISLFRYAENDPTLA